MLLRQRAWDMMREEFPKVEDSVTLAEASRTLREFMREHQEVHFITVTGKRGKFKGVVSIWTILKAVENCVLKDDSLKLTDDPGWDSAFARSCAICTQVDLGQYLNKDVPVFKPNDPLLVVLETFLQKKSGYGIVEEGEAIIGILLVSDLYRELDRTINSVSK